MEVGTGPDVGSDTFMNQTLPYSLELRFVSLRGRLGVPLAIVFGRCLHACMYTS